MATANKHDITLKQGKTTQIVIRCEIPDTLVYRAITSIFNSAPVRIVAPLHGMTNGQRAAVTGVLGMRQINAEANNVRDSDYRPVTVIDPNTIEINSINALLFSEYTSGGAIQYFEPLDISLFKARLKIVAKDGATLFVMTSEDGRIGMDAAARTITLFFDASDVADFSWKSAEYELEIYKSTTRSVQSPGGGAPTVVTTDTVYCPAFGKVTVEAEVVKP